jgi:hypothetical protein
MNSRSNRNSRASRVTRANPVSTATIVQPYTEHHKAGGVPVNPTQSHRMHSMDQYLESPTAMLYSKGDCIDPGSTPSSTRLLNRDFRIGFNGNAVYIGGCWGSVQLQEVIPSATTYGATMNGGTTRATRNTSPDNNTYNSWGDAESETNSYGMFNV